MEYKYMYLYLCRASDGMLTQCATKTHMCLLKLLKYDTSLLHYFSFMCDFQVWKIYLK